MIDKTADLLNCPFCGATAIFGIATLGGEYVECSSNVCGASSVLMFATMEDVKPILAEKWNRRANVSTQSTDAPDVSKSSEEIDTSGALTTQNWANLDGATAWHLIDRHADNVIEAGQMMEAWRDAAVHAALVPKYEEEEFLKMVERGTKAWAGTPNNWLEELRDSGNDPAPMAVMIACNTCGNKRCPKAFDNSNECTNSNEVGQVGVKNDVGAK